MLPTSRTQRSHNKCFLYIKYASYHRKPKFVFLEAPKISAITINFYSSKLWSKKKKRRKFQILFNIPNNDKQFVNPRKIEKEMNIPMATREAPLVKSTLPRIQVMQTNEWSCETNKKKVQDQRLLEPRLFLKPVFHLANFPLLIIVCPSQSKLHVYCASMASQS